MLRAVKSYARRWLIEEFHKALKTGVGAEALALLEKAYRKPKDGWTNQTVLISIARMGGFLARKGDGPPGWRILWQGWHRLMTMAEGVRLLLET